MPSEPIPPWFQRALSACESLSLDVASDRRKLWTAIKANLPREAIEAMVRDNISEVTDGDYDMVAARVTAAVMAALEEA